MHFGGVLEAEETKLLYKSVPRSSVGSTLMKPFLIFIFHLDRPCSHSLSSSYDSTFNTFNYHLLLSEAFRLSHMDMPPFIKQIYHQ